MDVVFFVAAFLAEIVGTLAGFGSSTIMLPVALLFFDFRVALVLVAFLHLFGNVGRIALFRKGISGKVFLYFGLIGVLGTITGAMLVTHVPQETLKLGLGVFLVGYGILAIVDDLRLKPTKLSMMFGGVTSGFLAGIIGTGGALRSAFLTAYLLPKNQYIGTAAAIAILVDGTRIPLYLKDGLLTQKYYWMIPLLFGAAVGGSYIGKRLVNKIPQKNFSKVVLLCLILAGLKLIVG